MRNNLKRGERMELSELYPGSIEILKNLIGEENYNSIKDYLQVYDGSASSIRPIAKHITIYWIGRACDRMILRTEGEDDVILSQVKDTAVPTIIFRKLKAVYLREFMKLVRAQWTKYTTEIKEWVGYKDEFLKTCSIAVGIVGERKGVMHGRCMKCPVDILMGATSAAEPYNLVSRFQGDSAYALTPSIERRTGTSVDEITYTTIMITEGMDEERRRTGGLFSETFVEPATLFVGKMVLPMISPPELVEVLWLLTRVIRVGARTSIQGTLEVHPIVMIGDLFETGTAYELAERLHGEKDISEAKKGTLEYIEEEAKYSKSSRVVELTADITKRLKEIDPLDQKLVRELWKNAMNYVKGVYEYLGISK